MSHCNEMICQQVTLSGYAEGPKVADAVIEASTWRGRPRAGTMRGGGQPGGWSGSAQACPQAAQGGLRVSPGNGFGSLEGLRGGGRGLDGLCSPPVHSFGQA